jgi:hypothetical protein
VGSEGFERTPRASFERENTVTRDAFSVRIADKPWRQANVSDETALLDTFDSLTPREICIYAYVG